MFSITTIKVVIPLQTSGNRQGHQRQVTSRPPIQQIHHRQKVPTSDTGNGLHAGDKGGASIPQKHKTTRITSRHRNDQGLLGVVHGRADWSRFGPSRPSHQSNARNRGFDLGKHAVRDAIHSRNNIRAGLTENNDQHGRFAVRVSRVPQVLDRESCATLRYRKRARPNHCGKR